MTAGRTHRISSLASRLGRATDLRVRLSARGPVDPELAWQRYHRLALWPTWSPQVRSVSAAQPELAAGMHGRVHGPVGITVNFVVLAVDPVARRWTWTVSRGPLRLHLQHGVQPDPGGGCRSWLTLDGPAPVLLAYLPLAGYALHRLVSLPDTFRPNAPATGSSGTRRPASRPADPRY